MNERIRELSFEAQRYALNNITGPDLAGLNELWQEKFAELIVRECAEVADNADAMRQKWEGIGKYVKEHFGIEND